MKRNQKVGHSNWKPRTETKAAQKFYSDRNAKVVARRVNDVRSRLAELEQSQIRKPPRELKFLGIPDAAGVPDAVSVAVPSSEVAVALTEVAVVGRVSTTNLSVARGEKWLITGVNGAGKSTLLGILAGLVEQDSGGVYIDPRLRTGLLAQHVGFVAGELRTTVEDVYQQRVGAELAERVPLSSFGLIAGKDEQQLVGELSVGQQRRLELAILLADPPELLLLDEPTNHFSLALVDALEQAIVQYPGTVIVVSHDRWLRRNWGGPQLELDASSIEL